MVNRFAHWIWCSCVYWTCLLVTSSCYEGLEDRPVFSYPPMKWFLVGRFKGKICLLTSMRASAGNRGLRPLEHSSQRVLSFMTALLLALTPAKRVEDRTALLVNLCCLLLEGDHRGATLRPNPSFVLNNLRSSYRWCSQKREVKLHLRWSANALACCAKPLAPIRCMEHFLWGLCSYRGSFQENDYYDYWWKLSPMPEYLVHCL